jgi:hypothetical protein
MKELKKVSSSVAVLSTRDLRMLEVNSFVDMCSVEEEVNMLTLSARTAIQYNLATRAMPWQVHSLSAEDGVDRAAALKNIVGLYDDGSPVPLTALQTLMFGTARKKLEWKTKKVRKQVDTMVEDIDVFMQSDQGCVDHINSYLIQSFILEQLSPFRRYAIKDEFFQYDDANPGPINGVTWMCGWFFLILLWLFLGYWCLQWAVQNSRITAISWTLQLIFVLAQEFCINENLQVLIMNIIVVETLRTQIKSIVDVLTSILVSKVGSSDGQKREDEGFNVAQHMSASCRMARKPILCNLVASKILMLITDHDIALCREARLTRIGFFTRMVITLPTLLALSHKSVQECFLDVLIPTIWCFFVLGNVFLMHISPALMAAPYVFLLLVSLYRYGYLLPKKRRRRQYQQNVLDQNLVVKKSHASGFEQHQDTEDNMWRNMNLSLSLNSCSSSNGNSESLPRGAPPSINLLSPRSQSVNHPLFSFEQHGFTPLDIPEEILAQQVQLSGQDKHFYDKNKKGQKKYQKAINKHLWNVDTPPPPPPAAAQALPPQSKIMNKSMGKSKSRSKKGVSTKYEEFEEEEEKDKYGEEKMEEEVADVRAHMAAAKLSDDWNDVFNTIGGIAFASHQQGETAGPSPLTKTESLSTLQERLRPTRSPTRSRPKMKSSALRHEPPKRPITSKLQSLASLQEQPRLLRSRAKMKSSNISNVDGRLLSMSSKYESRKHKGTEEASKVAEDTSTDTATKEGLVAGQQSESTQPSLVSTPTGKPSLVSTPTGKLAAICEPDKTDNKSDDGTDDKSDNKKVDGMDVMAVKTPLWSELWEEHAI